MKTEVIMERELFGGIIRQKSQNGYFSARDLERIGTLYRLQNGLKMFSLDNYLKSNTVKEFVEVLEEELGTKAIIKSENKGRNGTTWVHPYIFVDIALAIDPKFKIKVYSWITDELLKYRNKSGDSYLKMSGAIAMLSPNKALIKDNISDTAKKIKEALRVDNWQEASASQLEKRDQIHLQIASLSRIMRSMDSVVDLSISFVLGM